MFKRYFNSQEFISVIENEHKVPLIDELVDLHRMEQEFDQEQNSQSLDHTYFAYSRERKDVVDTKMIKNIEKLCHKAKLKFSPGFASYDIQVFFNGYQNIVETEENMALIAAYLDNLIYLTKCRVDLEIDRIEIFKAKYKNFDLKLNKNKPYLVITEGANYKKYDFSIEELMSFNYESNIAEKSSIDKSKEDIEYQISILEKDIENLDYKKERLTGFSKLFKSNSLNKQIEAKKKCIEDLNKKLKELKQQNFKRLAKLKYVKLTKIQKEEVILMLNEVQKLHYIVNCYLPDLEHSYLKYSNLYRLNYKEYVKSLNINKSEIIELIEKINEAIVKYGMLTRHLKNENSFGKNSYLEIGVLGYAVYKYLCEMENPNFKDELIKSLKPSFEIKQKQKDNKQTKNV